MFLSQLKMLLILSFPLFKKRKRGKKRKDFYFNFSRWLSSISAKKYSTFLSLKITQEYDKWLKVLLEEVQLG
jgi:hypothetical protein